MYLRSSLALAVNTGSFDELVLDLSDTFRVVFRVEMDSNAVDHVVSCRKAESG